MEYTYAQIKAKLIEIFFAKTSEEGTQIEAGFLDGKDDSFIEYFQAEKHSFQNDYRNEIKLHEEIIQPLTERSLARVVAERMLKPGL